LQGGFAAEHVFPDVRGNGVDGLLDRFTNRQVALVTFVGIFRICLCRRIRIEVIGLVSKHGGSCNTACIKSGTIHGKRLDAGSRLTACADRTVQNEVACLFTESADNCLDLSGIRVILNDNHAALGPGWQVGDIRLLGDEKGFVLEGGLHISLDLGAHGCLDPKAGVVDRDLSHAPAVATEIDQVIRDFSDHIINKIGIDLRGGHGLGFLPELKLGVQGIRVGLVFDHAQLVHLAQHDTHASQRIAAPRLRQRIVGGGSVRDAGQKSAFNQRELGCVLVKVGFGG